jgi:hypothetical protein
MSLSSSFTLSVNDDNDDGSTAEVEIDYAEFSSYLNRSEYISEYHTLAARDKLGFYRTLPKTSGNFRGVAKSAVKFTKDYEVAGVDAETTNIAPGIVEVNFAFPVGVTPADALELRMRAVALLQDDTIMVPLIDQQMI